MLSIFVAGAVGIEPTQMVLETIVLPLYEAPISSLHIIPNSLAERGMSYLVSLCEVCFRQCLQYLFISRRA